MKLRSVRLAYLALAVFAAGPALASPTSEIRKKFSELKIYDEKGNPWRAATEDWDGAKNRVANEPNWKQWLQKERKTVDDWISRTADRVEWASGSSHDGVGPDGSALIWTSKIPIEETPSFTSQSGAHVEITPKITGWWVVTFRARNADMMVRAARLYRMTGDQHYFNWVTRQLDFYAQNFLKWQPRRGGARLFGQTLTEATNLIKFAESIRILRKEIPDEKMRIWWDQLFKPEIDILNETALTIHNIACWHRSATAQIALVFGEEEIWRAALDGPYGIRQQCAEGITQDFLWQEQSFSYNYYALRAFSTLFTAAGLQGRATELANEMELVENLMLAPLYLRFPDGTLPTPSDSSEIKIENRPRTLVDNYRIYPTRLGLSGAVERFSWDTLLDPPAPVPNSALPQVESNNLESMRMAVLRSGSWQIFFHYGQISKSHTQAEALNYTAYYGEVPITRDAGTTRYGSPLHKDYFTRGPSQNAPLIDGLGQKSSQPGELIAFSTNPPLVRASQPKYQPRASVIRTLKIEDPKLIESTELNSRIPAKLGVVLNIQGRAKIPTSFKPDPTFYENRPEAFKYWTNVTSAQFDGHATFEIDYGAVTMLLTFSANQKFTIWHATTPDKPPKKREGFYLEATSATANFTTTWEPALKPTIK